MGDVPAHAPAQLPGPRVFSRPCPHGRCRGTSSLRAPVHKLQIETLVELRAMYLESKGKMSRYGPLAVLETVK